MKLGPFGLLNKTNIDKEWTVISFTWPSTKYWRWALWYSPKHKEHRLKIKKYDWPRGFGMALYLPFCVLDYKAQTIGKRT